MGKTVWKSKQEREQLKVGNEHVLMRRRHGVGRPIINYLCKMRKKEESNPSRIMHAYIIQNTNIYITNALYN